MRAKIFSFVKVSDNSMVASVKIARHVSRVLGVPVLSDENIDDGAPLDVLIIINGAYAFSQALEELGSAVQKAKRVVWVQNDYTIIPPIVDGKAVSPFRKAFRDRHAAAKSPIDYWTTVKTNSGLTKRSEYVNWNCLTFDESKSSNALVGLATPSLLYYGSFRTGRERYFDRYFREPETTCTISSPSKRFAELYHSERIQHVDKFGEDFYEQLASHGLGLYIEDRRSHKEFHSPANRFYEMLSAGLPMIFQSECGPMMRRGGYDPTPFTADGPKAAARCMDARLEIRRAQRAAWWEKAAGERRLLDDQLMIAWNKTRESL